jgi:hypothetical protein
MTPSIQIDLGTKTKPVGKLEPLADPAIDIAVVSTPEKPLTQEQVTTNISTVKAARMEAWACPEDPVEIETGKQERIAAWELQNGKVNNATIE